MRGESSGVRSKTPRVTKVGIEVGDLFTFRRPTGQVTVEEIGVVSFEPRKPCKTSH
jgi:hypothetical protein